jgi:pimeloyl-ACP methyl ester carboxylesterase
MKRGVNPMVPISFRFRLLCRSLLLAMLVALPAAAQEPARGPAPETVTLRAADGVQLTLTYYASPVRKGTPQAKQVAPVVLLHDYKDTRVKFAPLARQLQSQGDADSKAPSFAAVIVDLRGHGDSTKQFSAAGGQRELDVAKIGKNDVADMATLDMEEVRKFIVGKNDAGELNLNKLCLIGTGMGANVAVNWAARDWATPPLAVGKQGQDVKAIVLISPRWSYQGLGFQAPLAFRPLNQNVAWMLIYGTQDPKVKTDADRIYKQLERYHPAVAANDTGRQSNLVAIELPSKLQGDSLLTQAGQATEDQIVAFLTEHVAKIDMPWQARRDRLP